MQNTMMNSGRHGPGPEPREEKPDSDLRRRQRDHLERVKRNTRTRPSDCLHNQCSLCVGTEVRKDGSRCVHLLSCPCGKCTPGM